MPPKRNLSFDLLRLIAVLLVLGYHFEIPVLKNFGFLGVDIFFVLSGYLSIFSLLNKKHDFTSGSLAHIFQFGISRFKRLIPGLLIILFFIYLATLCFVPQPDSDIFISQIPRVLNFSLNTTLAESSLDYFAQDQKYNPLLHLWSIAAEFKFYGYLIVAAILVEGSTSLISTTFDRKSLFAHCSIETIRRRTLFLLLALLFAASLYAYVVSNISANTYYLDTLRFWQFLLGALLALYVLDVNQRHCPSIGKNDILVGRLFLILICIGSLFTLILPNSLLLSDKAPHILVTVTAAALILNSIPDEARFTFLLPARLSTILTGAALTSYEIYLIHWPLIALSRWTIGFAHPGIQILTLFLTFAMGIALFLSTKKLFEDPWRYWLILPFSGILLVSISFLPRFLSKINYSPYVGTSRFSKSDLGGSGFSESYPSRLSDSKRLSECSAFIPSLRLAPSAYFDRCIVQQPHAKGTIYVLGDSTVGALKPILEEYSEKYALSLSLHSIDACNYLLQHSEAGLCASSTDAYLNYVSTKISKSDTVILSFLGQDLPPSLNAHFLNSSAPQQLISFASSLPSSVPLVYISPLPTFPVSEPILCFGNFQYVPSGCSVSKQRIADQAKYAFSQFLYMSLKSVHRSTILLDSVDRLCRPDACTMVSDGRAFYKDGAHLTTTGARLLLEPYLKSLECLLKGKESRPLFCTDK